jgi:transcriptional antiterminator
MTYDECRSLCINLGSDAQVLDQLTSHLLFRYIRLQPKIANLNLSETLCRR